MLIYHKLFVERSAEVGNLQRTPILAISYPPLK